MIYHSVTLIENKCTGCTTCIESCPTEAIRVTNGKARIIKNRCIDCGECIRHCPSHAKQSLSDSLASIGDYKYTAVIPPPALYGQFSRKIKIHQILQGLLDIGFNEVFEAAQAADLASAYVNKILKDPNRKKPLISSSCPACVRFIQVKFPSLIPNIIKIESPMEAAARIIRSRHPEFKREELGIFFITPCPAKITSVRSPLGGKTSQVDKVIPIKDIYLPLLSTIGEKAKQDQENFPRSYASGKGIAWGNRDGESDSISTENCLSADGIHAITKFLEKIENGIVTDIDYIEIDACPGGCVGGALAVEDPHIARMRVQYHIRKEFDQSSPSKNDFDPLFLDQIFSWTEEIEPREVLKLSDNFAEAMEKLERLESILETLPGLNCGACGAPNCRALAEDVVQNHASTDDCVVIMKSKLKELTLQIEKMKKAKN